LLGIREIAGVAACFVAGSDETCRAFGDVFRGAVHEHEWLAQPGKAVGNGFADLARSADTSEKNGHERVLDAGNRVLDRVTAY
jgi:hypothetical protein